MLRDKLTAENIPAVTGYFLREFSSGLPEEREQV